MLSDTSTKALEEEATYMSRKPNCPNFLFGFAALIFVMIMAAVSYLAYPRFMLMSAVELIVRMLNFTYARVLYDRGCKTLRAILKSVRSSLYPKLNHSGGKSRGKGRGKGKSRGKGRDHGSRSKAKQKAELKGYRGLLVLMVITGVFCVLGSGEAVWFSHNNDSEAAEGVNEVLDDRVVGGVSIEVC